MATGVDRVERAWIDHVLTLDRPVFGLARIRRATVLLDRDGVRRASVFEEEGRARALDRLRGRGETARAKAEGAVVANAMCRWRGIPDSAALGRILGHAPRYLSVGHAGLDARCLGAMAGLAGARTAVLVHDTIPLDLPQTQTPQAVKRFREKLGWVARAADVVIAPTAATAADIDRHLDAMNRRCMTMVCPPGVSRHAAGLIPRAVQTDRPFFLALGTIEPRKNHALLLDLWEKLRNVPNRPRLVIAGRRGWRNEAVFRRLDACAGKGDVIELNDLDDGAVSALLASANGLLFPSLAEGFGYPPLEAAGLGTPVVASPLPQVRELLGNTAVYAEPGELYAWEVAIRDLAGTRVKRAVPRLPTWQTHFNGVLSSIG